MNPPRFGISRELQPRRAAERRESCISCLGPSCDVVRSLKIFSLCKSNCRLAWNYLTRTKPFASGFFWWVPCMFRNRKRFITLVTCSGDQMISQPPGEDLFSEIPIFFHSTHKRYSTRYRSMKKTKEQNNIRTLV